MTGTDRQLYSSKAEGEQYILQAASAEEADSQMDEIAKQQGMLSHEPCVLIPRIEVDGHTFWQVPD